VQQWQKIRVTISVSIRVNFWYLSHQCVGNDQLKWYRDIVGHSIEEDSLASSP